MAWFAEERRQCCGCGASYPSSTTTSLALWSTEVCVNDQDQPIVSRGGYSVSNASLTGTNVTLKPDFTPFGFNLDPVNVARVPPQAPFFLPFAPVTLTDRVQFLPPSMPQSVYFLNVGNVSDPSLGDIPLAAEVKNLTQYDTAFARGTGSCSNLRRGDFFQINIREGESTRFEFSFYNSYEVEAFLWAATPAGQAALCRTTFDSVPLPRLS